MPNRHVPWSMICLVTCFLSASFFALAGESVPARSSLGPDAAELYANKVTVLPDYEAMAAEALANTYFSQAAMNKRVLLYYGNGGYGPDTDPFPGSAEYFAMQMEMAAQGLFSEYTDQWPEDLTPYKVIFLLAPCWQSDDPSKRRDPDAFTDDQVEQLKAFLRIQKGRLIIMSDWYDLIDQFAMNDLVSQLLLEKACDGGGSGGPALYFNETELQSDLISHTKEHKFTKEAKILRFFYSTSVFVRGFPPSWLAKINPHHTAYQNVWVMATGKKKGGDHDEGGCDNTDGGCEHDADKPHEDEESGECKPGGGEIVLIPDLNWIDDFAYMGDGNWPADNEDLFRNLVKIALAPDCDVDLILHDVDNKSLLYICTSTGFYQLVCENGLNFSGYGDLFHDPVRENILTMYSAPNADHTLTLHWDTANCVASATFFCPRQNLVVRLYNDDPCGGYVAPAKSMETNETFLTSLGELTQAEYDALGTGVDIDPDKTVEDGSISADKGVDSTYGNRVLFYYGNGGIGPQTEKEDLSSYYEAIQYLQAMGLSSSYTQYWPANLDAFKIIFLLAPGHASETTDAKEADDYFTSDQVGQLREFLARGGRLIIMTDNWPFTGQDVENDLLDQLSPAKTELDGNYRFTSESLAGWALSYPIDELMYPGVNTLRFMNPTGISDEEKTDKPLAIGVLTAINPSHKMYPGQFTMARNIYSEDKAAGGGDIILIPDMNWIDDYHYQGNFNWQADNEYALKNLVRVALSTSICAFDMILPATTEGGFLSICTMMGYYEYRDSEGRFFSGFGTFNPYYNRPGIMEFHSSPGDPCKLIVHWDQLNCVAAGQVTASEARLATRVFSFNVCPH